MPVDWIHEAERGDAAAHTGHELVSLDVGLAVGFLFLAWRPSRAWGALPLVTLLVAGLVCSWALARRAPRSSIELRLG